MSKGSWYRPVNREKYEENYERIFGKVSTSVPSVDTSQSDVPSKEKEDGQPRDNCRN